MIKENDRVRVISTGAEVTVERIVDDDYIIVRFSTGDLVKMFADDVEELGDGIIHTPEDTLVDIIARGIANEFATRVKNLEDVEPVYIAADILNKIYNTIIIGEY